MCVPLHFPSGRKKFGPSVVPVTMTPSLMAATAASGRRVRSQRGAIRMACTLAIMVKCKTCCVVPDRIFWGTETAACGQFWAAVIPVLFCDYRLISFSKNGQQHRWPRGGGMGGEFPRQPPISYLVTYELFETLMYCVPPPSTKTHGHLWVTTVKIWSNEISSPTNYVWGQK